MEILFDTLPLDITGTSNLQCVVILPVSPMIDVISQIIVIFNEILTYQTTVVVSDTISSVSITVQPGTNYGIGYYTPSISGSKNISIISQAGQSNIDFPQSLPDINVNTQEVTDVGVDPEVFLERPRGKKFDGYTNQFVSV